ncbi:hypothetical protein JNB88_27305 [Rhizobium cauense]|uniref:hypothetical protein n=1 Tax=Rhizobium cauense TaxID=1166683 RepID=UPI001C6ECCF5|nr:hypothetical protein [Rhizobium cauense]MBW9117331.1 hypothetical protein [Rhizobium cauense]
MAQKDILTEPSDTFARRLSEMIDDELFETMEVLEDASEARQNELLQEVLFRIALTEDEIERRYPGQLLVPYRDWKHNRGQR